MRLSGHIIKVVNAYSRFVVVHGRSRRRGKSSLILPRDQPLQHSVQIGFLLGTDPVATGLATSESFEVHFVDELVYRQLSGKIGLVSKNEQWDPLQPWLLKECVEFLGSDGDCCFVCGVDNVSGKPSDDPSNYRHGEHTLLR